MGYISYNIKAKQNLTTGTEIRNIAYITFDYTETIATNQIDPHDPSAGTDPNLECLITIDAHLPDSYIEPLNAESLSPLALNYPRSRGNSNSWTVANLVPRRTPRQKQPTPTAFTPPLLS